MRNFQSIASIGLLFLVAATAGCQEPTDLKKADQVQADEDRNSALTRIAEDTEKLAASLPAEEIEQTPKSDRTKQTIDIPESWKRLSKKDEIWIDPKAKEVIIAGHVCLSRGGLEMFICPEGTKEHESIIAAHALSSQVHACLIKLGADPGKSTSWDPEYRAAYGPSIDVMLKWQDAETKKTKTMPAKQWIRNFKTKKAMTETWVFGGSEFWKDPDSGDQVYYGDSGELICLSNFGTATIDVNVESSQANAGLLYEAFTENIPPIGTKVYAIIKPGKRIEPESKPETKKSNPENSDATSNKSDGKQ
jgi:hypothetical protein